MIPAIPTSSRSGATAPTASNIDISTSTISPIPVPHLPHDSSIAQELLALLFDTDNNNSNYNNAMPPLTNDDSELPAFQSESDDGNGRSGGPLFHACQSFPGAVIDFAVRRCEKRTHVRNFTTDEVTSIINGSDSQFRKEEGDVWVLPYYDEVRDEATGEAAWVYWLAVWDFSKRELVILDVNDRDRWGTKKMDLANGLFGETGPSFDVVEPQVGWIGEGDLSMISLLFVCSWIMELNQRTPNDILQEGVQHARMFEEFMPEKRGRERWRFLADDLKNISWVQVPLTLGGDRQEAGKDDFAMMDGDYDVAEGLNSFREWLESQVIIEETRKITSDLVFSDEYSSLEHEANMLLHTAVTEASKNSQWISPSRARGILIDIPLGGASATPGIVSTRPFFPSSRSVLYALPENHLQPRITKRSDLNTPAIPMTLLRLSASGDAYLALSPQLNMSAPIILNGLPISSTRVLFGATFGPLPQISHLRIGHRSWLWVARYSHTNSPQVVDNSRSRIQEQLSHLLEFINDMIQESGEDGMKAAGLLERLATSPAGCTEQSLNILCRNIAALRQAARARMENGMPTHQRSMRNRRELLLGGSETGSDGGEVRGTWYPSPELEKLVYGPTVWHYQDSVRYGAIPFGERENQTTNEKEMQKIIGELKTLFGDNIYPADERTDEKRQQRDKVIQEKDWYINEIFKASESGIKDETAFVSDSYFVPKSKVLHRTDWMGDGIVDTLINAFMRPLDKSHNDAVVIPGGWQGHLMNSFRQVCDAAVKTTVVEPEHMKLFENRRYWIFPTHTEAQEFAGFLYPFTVDINVVGVASKVFSVVQPEEDPFTGTYTKLEEYVKSVEHWLETEGRIKQGIKLYASIPEIDRRRGELAGRDNDPVDFYEGFLSTEYLHAILGKVGFRHRISEATRINITTRPPPRGSRITIIRSKPFGGCVLRPQKFLDQGGHWWVCIFDKTTGALWVHDSMSEGVEANSTKILSHNLQNFVDMHFPDLNLRVTRQRIDGALQQHDVSSCGFFMCLNMILFLLRGYNSNITPRAQQHYANQPIIRNNSGITGQIGPDFRNAVADYVRSRVPLGSKLSVASVTEEVDKKQTAYRKHDPSGPPEGLQVLDGNWPKSKTMKAYQYATDTFRALVQKSRNPDRYPEIADRLELAKYYLDNAGAILFTFAKTEVDDGQESGKEAAKDPCDKMHIVAVPPDTKAILLFEPVGHHRDDAAYNGELGQLLQSTQRFSAKLVDSDHKEMLDINENITDGTLVTIDDDSRFPKFMIANTKETEAYLKFNGAALHPLKGRNCNVPTPDGQFVHPDTAFKSLTCNGYQFAGKHERYTVKLPSAAFITINNHVWCWYKPEMSQEELDRIKSRNYEISKRRAAPKDRRIQRKAEIRPHVDSTLGSFLASFKQLRSDLKQWKECVLKNGTVSELELKWDKPTDTPEAEEEYRDALDKHGEARRIFAKEVLNPVFTDEEWRTFRSAVKSPPTSPPSSSENDRPTVSTPKTQEPPKDGPDLPSNHTTPRSNTETYNRESTPALIEAAKPIDDLFSAAALLQRPLDEEAQRIHNALNPPYGGGYDDIEPAGFESDTSQDFTRLLRQPFGIQPRRRLHRRLDEEGPLHSALPFYDHSEDERNPDRPASYEKRAERAHTRENLELVLSATNVDITKVVIPSAQALRKFGAELMPAGGTLPSHPGQDALVKKLKEQLYNEKEKRGRMREANRAYKTKLEQKFKAREECDKRMRKLLDHIDKNAEEVQHIPKDLQKDIQKVSEEHKKLYSELDSLLRQFKKAQDALTEVPQRVAKALEGTPRPVQKCTICANHEPAFASLSTEIVQLKDQIKTLTESRNSCWSEFENLQRIYEQKREENAELESAIRKMNSGKTAEILQKSKSAAHAKHHSAHLAAINGWLQNTIENLRDKLITTVESLSEAKTHGRLLEAQLKSVTHSYNATKRRLDMSEARISTEEQLAGITDKDTIAMIVNQYKTSLDKADEADAQVQGATDYYDQAIQQVQDLFNQNDALMNTVDRLNGELALREEMPIDLAAAIQEIRNIYASIFYESIEDPDKSPVAVPLKLIETKFAEYLKHIEEATQESAAEKRRRDHELEELRKEVETLKGQKKTPKSDDYALQLENSNLRRKVQYLTDKTSKQDPKEPGKGGSEECQRKCTELEAQLEKANAALKEKAKETTTIEATVTAEHIPTTAGNSETRAKTPTSDEFIKEVISEVIKDRRLYRRERLAAMRARHSDKDMSDEAWDRRKDNNKKHCPICGKETKKNTHSSHTDPGGECRVYGLSHFIDKSTAKSRGWKAGAANNYKCPKGDEERLRLPHPDFKLKYEMANKWTGELIEYHYEVLRDKYGLPEMDLPTPEMVNDSDVSWNKAREQFQHGDDDSDQNEREVALDSEAETSSKRKADGEAEEEHNSPPRNSKKQKKT